MLSLFERPVFPPTQMPYRVHSCGRIVNQPRHATQGTYNQDCMLTVFLKGIGYYRHEGEDIQVRPGMVGLVLPQPQPGILIADESDPYDHFFCRFTGEVALTAARRIIRARGGEVFAPSDLWPEVAEVLQRIQALRIPYEPEADTYTDRMRPCDGLIAQALAILDCPEEGRGGLTAGAVGGFIGEHLAQPLRIAAMAEHFSVTKEYLCRRVRALTGRSPLDLWREAKINWAKTLLTQAGMSVAETARRVGFDDPYYFSKVFKKCSGTSPAHFLRRAANEKNRRSEP